LILLVGSCDL